MKTIQIKFKSNDETIKKTAILSDSLSELSKSKKNQADDIIIDYWPDGFWILFFYENDNLQYEIEFKYDRENDCQTLTPIKAITWENNVITDSQFIDEIKITQK